MIDRKGDLLEAEIPAKEEEKGFRVCNLEKWDSQLCFKLSRRSQTKKYFGL